MPDPKKKLDLSAGNAILKSSQKIDLSAGDAILKKKESTQPTSQEEVWGSNSQPKDAYTSLVIDQQIPQQESVILDGEQPKPILKGLPSVESLKKKTIQPKKETVEIIKDVVPKVAKAISIEKNKEDFSESTQKARKESKSLVDKKQIDQKISEVSGLQNEYAKSLKDIDLAKKQLSDEKAEIDYQLSIGNNTPEFQQKIALHNAKVQENLDKFNLLKDKSEVINYNKKVIKSASGNLLRNKAEQGNWFGAIYNKMLEGASSISSGATSLLIDLATEITPSKYLIGPEELKRLQNKGLSQDQIDDYIKKSAKKDIIPVIRKGNVELLGDKGTTEEFVKKKESSGLIEGGVLGLAGSVPAMLGGVYGRAINFFSIGTDAVNQEMESNPDFQNISENEKLAVIVPIGIANAVLEEFGLQGVMKNNSLVNNLVHKTLLKVGADASADTFKRAMNNEIKSGIASGLFKVGSGFTSEAITGGSQQAAEIGIKDIYNVVKDKKMFQTPETLSDAVSQISEAAIMEGIGGTVMSTLPAINTAMQNNELGKKSTDFEFEILDNINENSEEFKKLFTSDLKNKMIEGKITKDEAESQLKSFDKMTSIFNRMPKDMSIEDKKESFDLLVEKDKLTDEINGKDESLSTKQKERISEINKELSDISLGVKPKEEIVVETPEASITEVDNKQSFPEELANQYKERIVSIKESDPEQYWSVDVPSDEIILDAAKNGRLIDKQGGMGIVTEDGNMIGMFKYDKESKGTAQAVQEERVKLGGVKLDNFDGYLTKLYQKNGFRIVSRVPFNEEYAPVGWKKEKHGTPDVVAMVYDPNNELDIKEKTFEDYDEAMAYRDSFVDQANDLKAIPTTIQEVFDESEKSMDLPNLVEKAKTSLSKMLPEVDVILHNTDAEYEAAVGESVSSGAFINNTVHINPNKANGRTVAHEVFHAVLLNMVKSDPAAQRVTAAMITAIEKVLPPGNKAILQDFVESGYDSQRELWNEEKLAELVGYLAENFDSLSQPAKNIIKQWLDQLAKLVGLKEFTDKEVIDFINTISGKIASGEEITEEDVKIFKGGKKITDAIKGLTTRFQYGNEKVKINIEYVEQDRMDSLVEQGLVEQVDDLSILNGKYSVNTSPDDMFVGSMFVNGQKVSEGNGGMYFVTKFGDVWALSKKAVANRFANAINESSKINGGKAYVALVKGTDAKLVNSPQGVTSSLAVVESMLDGGLISLSDFRKSIKEAVKKHGGNINLDNKLGAKDLKKQLDDYFKDVNSSTFEKRGNVLKSIVANIAQSKSFQQNKEAAIDFLDGDKTKSVGADSTPKSQALIDLIAKVSAEKLTKGLNTGDIYAVIEVDGEVAVIEDEHQSYPFHIKIIDKDGNVSKTKPKLILPNNRQSGKEILTSVDGKTINDLGDKKFAGMVGATANMPYSKGIINTNALNTPNRKQADTVKDRKQTNRPSVNKIYDQSEQAIKDRNKNASIKDLGPYLRKSLLDRQAYIKRLLDRIDNKSAKKAYDLLVTKAGASALAAERFKQAEKQIYGKLNSEDTKTLDKIIYARRIVAVNESRAQLGMPAYTGIDGYSLEDAKQDLADFKQELGDKKFSELSDRATTYFNVFKENLRKLYDSGRISKEVYDSLRNTEYSPIKTIKYIIGDNLSPDEIDTQAKSLGISRKDIMKLSDSNENEIILDSKWLLAMNIGSVEGRAFENRMLNEFNKAIESATADEKKAFEEFVLDNPVVGTKKDGSLKYKYDDVKVPVGYTKVSFFENGNKREIVLKDVYAKQLLDVKNKNTFLETIGKLTGTQILRFFATGGNPLFIIGNTAVDFQNIAFWSDTYSKFKPLAAAQLMRDFTKNFIKKAVVSNKYNAIFNEYINHGGALDYLSNDGLKALESMNPVKSVTKQAQKGLLAYGRAMAFLGETSEVAFRLSVFEKVKEDSLKDFRKENGREPNFQEKEDILWKAAREARETMDFSQGGDVAKNIDSVFPYFNAALQGVRRPIDFAMKNPVGFASSVLQYTAMAGSLTAASLAMLIKSVRDDEDDDEEANKKILQVLNSVSEYEKANYHVLFTGNKNKDGEYEYYRIKKLPVLSVISTVGDQLIYNEFFKKAGIDYKIDKEAIQEAAVKSNPLPMTVQELAGKNPVASGLVSYWANKDTFTGEKIFREPNNKKILPEAEGIFDDKVDQVYKDLAPGFGLSPARTKVMVEKVITSENTNPTIPLIYSAYDGIFNKKDGLGNEVSEAMSNVGKAFGKKLVRYTDKNIIRYKKQDEMEYKESVTETDIWKKEQKVYNEIKSAYKEGDGLTQKELVSLVKENFEPIDRLKYVKKYNTYIHNMNIDKSVLDIIFEDVPEVQAMKLNQRYGSSLEKEEMKELGQAMGSAGRKINTKTMYIYNKKYKERKPAN